MSRAKRPTVRMGPLTTAAETPSLMSEFTGISAQVTVTELPVESVVPRSTQPRRSFSEESLQGLAQSVAQHGILQPLSVLESAQGYQLIAGERRLRAAKLAGLATVPVKVFHGLTEAQVQQLSAIENLQREDLNPVDEVDALLDILAVRLSVPRQQLTPYLERLKSIQMRDPQFVRASGEDQQAIAEVREIFEGLSRGNWTSFVANRLPVLRLPEDLLQAVRENRLEYTKAVALRRVPAKERKALIRQAQELSVHQLRQQVRATLAGEADTSAEPNPLEWLKKASTAQRYAQLSATQQREVQRLTAKLRRILAPSVQE
ncbi:chromosome partitioning protein ParB [Deinococcus piscis]|uniref:Chromosome partitioning protein ParB n=1 Tax=Deinococcus piscis TaxID=394230 RepID=A0ABQ3K7M0_9DEIO|nr:ParB/RepB/Spo0J family partition protein [Deinococcus piscis]GHG02750.1 chromosome partitioning protein ParB [Deinococcus piscis]